MKNILYIVLVALIVSLASAQSMGSIGASWSEDLSALRNGYMEFLSTYGGELDQGASDRKFLEEIISELTLSSEVKIKGDVLSSRFMNKDRPAAPLKNSLSVCIVVSSFEGIYINSGIGTAYSALAEYLVSEGQRVTVLYTGPVKGNKDFNFWKQLYQEKGIELVQFAEGDYDLKISSSELATQSYKVYQHLSQESFDVIHFPEWEGIGYYSLLAKREGLSFLNTKMIVGLHGSTRWTLSAKNQVPTTVTELEADFMEQKSVELADMVWAPSEYYAHYTAEQGWKLPTDKFLMPFLMGSGLENLAASVKPRAKLNEVNEIVFFGRFETRKGLDLFLDAIDLLADQTNAPDLKITFLGKSVEVHGQDANEYIQSRSSAWPFTIKIINHYDRATALKYLATHGRLAVMPSLIENTPYVAYEALVLNLPFIATDTETVRDLISEEDQDAVLVDINAESLARGLANAISNGIIRAKPAFSAESAKNSWRYFYNYVATVNAAVTSKVNRNPLVSICIVHYNRPALLKQTLESVYAQDYSNIEVILVDDGSTDAAAIAYLQSLEGSFYSRGWKVIFSENKYLGAARNLAAQNAEGEFLFFLDDDNLIRTNTISTYVRVALQTGTNLLTAAHDVFPGLKKPTIKDITERWVPLGGSVAVGLFKNSFGDANFFVSRQGFNEVGGFSEDRGVGLEDHEFHAKWVLSGKQMEVIPVSLLYYRMHDKQNQMIYTTDPLMNQFRYLRSYSDVFNNEAADMFRFMNAKRAVSLACNETIITVSDTISDFGGTIYFTGAGFLCAQPYVVNFDGTSHTCTVNAGYTDTSFSCTANWFNEQFPTLGETGITIKFLNGDYITESIEVVAAEAPVLVRAQFNTIGQIEATFDESTDEADGLRGCENYWDADTVASFGTGAYCAFTDDKTITVTLGAGATIVAGDKVTLGPGNIRKLGETQTGRAAQGFVVVENPEDVPSVGTAVSVSDVVSDCGDIVIVGTAFEYGRDLVAYEWSLENDGEAVDVTGFVKGRDLYFPAGSLAAGFYTVSLYAKNWYGDAEFDSANFTVEHEVIPFVSMESVVKGLRTRTIVVSPQITLISCSEEGVVPDFTYSWTSAFIPQGVDTSSPELELPPYSLEAGQSYNWKFSLTYKGNSVITPVEIVILAQEPSLSVADSLTVGVGKDAELTVEYYYDDYPEAVPSFLWSCESCGIATFSDPTSASTSLSDLSLGEYKVQVALTFAQYGTIYGYTTVTVVPGNPPKVVGLLFYVNDEADYTLYIPVSSRTVVKPQGDSSELNSVESWFWEVSPAVEGLDVNVRNLYVPPESLVPFTRYTFTVYASRDGETAKAVGKRISWSLPSNGEISLRVGQETGFYQNQTYFVDFDHWVPVGSDPSVLQYSVYIDGFPFVVDSSSNTVGPFLLLPGTHTIQGIVRFGLFEASKTFTVVITSDQCLRFPSDAFTYVVLLRPIQPADITSLSALAMGAPLVISCIENSEDGSATELQDARQEFLDYTDQFIEELTPTPDNAEVGLELLLIALGTSERFGNPGDLPITQENVETIALLFNKTSAAFENSPSSAFSDPDTINEMFNVASKVAEYILSYYLQLNNNLRAVSDQELTVDEFLYSFNSFLDSIASSITVAEGSRFYEDANVGIFVEKVALNKIVGDYSAARGNVGATAYITKPVRTFLSELDTFGEVGVVVVHWKSNLRGDDVNHEIVGGFLSVRFVNENEPVKIEGLSMPSVVSHYLDGVFDENNLPVCVYWNETTQSWEENGVSLYNDDDEHVVQCATTHFTDFAVATIFVDCDGNVGGNLVVDECGVCGGDGSTCCSNYLGVDNKVWDFVLLPVAVRDMIERLENTRAVLEYVYDNIPEEDELRVEMQWGDVAEINNIFNDQCITPFCSLSKNFMGDLLEELRTEY